VRARRHRSPKTKELGSTDGFTLLEMLVALTIFSIAGLALVRLQAVSARTSVDLRARTITQIVARNLMIERLTDPAAPSLGVSQGSSENAGRQWNWAQQVEKADEGRMLLVTIRVDAGPGQSPAVLSFGRAP
jgi:general secretion pathway protein I